MVLENKITQPRRIGRADGAYNNSYPEGLIGIDQFPDSGCTLPSGRVLPSCLNCPLAVCIEDIPEGKQLQKMRGDNIRKMRKNGFSAKTIAKRFGVSARQVHRLVAAGKKS